jgi:hypothetical protein
VEIGGVSVIEVVAVKAGISRVCRSGIDEVVDTLPFVGTVEVPKLLAWVSAAAPEDELVEFEQVRHTPTVDELVEQVALGDAFPALLVRKIGES